MGTPGVKFDVDKAVLIDIINRKGGRMIYICSELGIGRDWLRKKLKSDPELLDIMVQARKDYCESLTTIAEDGLMFYMTRREEYPNQALKCIMFVLNNLGREIGYSPPIYTSSIVSEDVNTRFNLVMDQLQALGGHNDLNNAEINISPAE